MVRTVGASVLHSIWIMLGSCIQFVMPAALVVLLELYDFLCTEYMILMVSEVISHYGNPQQHTEATARQFDWGFLDALSSLTPSIEAGDQITWQLAVAIFRRQIEKEKIYIYCPVT
jgi:hypothetical protein